ncbi:hypothetical protein TNIN_135531 [Trichonephila inaurata madagascariensis]|uniref:Uncharacterized protein n=1 Tax=Trichonephila inaurata madagascariensis TaxID=2747483 RepID=A0A8X6WZB6_9ARAC|nr:hypothetical protein TNIN_135531 [Trichonephila inaurata madagascariensis]
MVGHDEAPLLRIVRISGDAVSFKKGYGLGRIFRRLLRAALPFLVKGGKEALRTGTRVVSDVLSGEDFKISARKRSEEAG